MKNKSHNPPETPSLPYVWSGEEYRTLAQVERAIACSVANDLCNGDAGSVTCGDKRYSLLIRTTLLP